jgi:hypothetical protein
VVIGEIIEAREWMSRFAGLVCVSSCIGQTTYTGSLQASHEPGYDGKNHQSICC